MDLAGIISPLNKKQKQITGLSSSCQRATLIDFS